MLLRRRDSTLLLIDVQERLHPHIRDAERILANCIWLAKLAAKLEIDTCITEQYPQGLGPTVAPLIEAAPSATVVTKIDFSCANEPALMRLPALAQPQLVIAGTEAHVCVLQSAIELRELGKEVFVVADAVGSRTEENRQLALERLRAHDIQIVSREMVAYEWLRAAGTELFRAINRDFLR